MMFALPVEDPSMTITRVLVALLCATTIYPAVPAFAQGYPTRPVRLVVPFPAGSATDLVARQIAPQLQEDLSTDPIEQRDIELLFELANARGHVRLRGMQALGGRAEGAELCDPVKGFELPDVHG
jgi:hypothetical protein